jgi:hypothetical protein
VRRVAGVVAAGALLFGSLCAAAPTVGAAPAVVPPPVSGWTSFAVGVKANAIVFDATRNKLLAALPGSVTGLGNDLVELDPSTGALGRSVFVGANPSTLAISADGTTLYVGFGSADRIARVNLVTFKVVSTFSTGADSFEGAGPNYVRHLAVAPDDDNVVVASLRNGNATFTDFVAYDNGVALAQHDPYPGTFVDSFTFGATSSTVYGNGDTLSTWTLGSGGLTLAHSAGGLVTTFSTMKFAGNRLYDSVGAIVDPTTSSLLGTIPANGSAVDPVPGANRVYYLDGGVLEEYRSDTFAPVASKTLTSFASGGVVSDLVSTSVGVAALLSDGTVYLAGAVIGPQATITLPQAPDHISHLVPHFGSQPLAAMINDPYTGKILGAVPATASTNANAVVEIDPVTGAIGRHVLAGSDPNVLALSDDGSILYVGLEGANRIATISVANFTNTGSFGLGAGLDTGPFFAASIAVQPGSPHTVAVARYAHNTSPPLQGGVAIYDSGVQRPVVATADGCTGSVAFGDTSTLFGADAGCPASTFQTMSVDAAGGHVESTGEGFRKGPVIGTVGGIAILPCIVIATKTLDVLGNYPGCVDAIDPSNNRAYELNTDDNTVSEDELLTMRRVKTVPLYTGVDASRVITTSAGFAVLDSFSQSWSLLVDSSFSVSVRWSTSDAARISQIAAFKGWTPAQVQKNGVALVAYLTAVVKHSTTRTTWTPPPLGSDTTITSTWTASDLAQLKYVEFMYAVNDVNAVRLGVEILSYELALTGH